MTKYEGTKRPHLLDMLAQHAAVEPEKAAVVFLQGDHKLLLSYKELLEQANQIAKYLDGYTSGSIVFIALKHSPHLYTVFLGCMLAGLVPAFLPFPSSKQNPHFFFAQHRELFRRTPPACVMTYAALIQPLRDILPSEVPVLDVEPSLWHEADSSRNRARRSNVALLQHSSGTTGLKKGVALSFEQIALQTAAYAPAVQLDTASVVVSWLPLYHDMGLFTAFLIPFAVGATVVSMDAFEWVREPVKLLQAVEAYRGTHVWLPNFAFEHILSAVDDDDDFRLDSLALVASCSEPVKPGTIRRFVKRFPALRSKVRACYAMAEASFAVSQGGSAAEPIFAAFDTQTLEHGCRPRRVFDAGPAAPKVRELTSNGRPIPNIEVAIDIDNDREFGPCTSVGEIVLRGSFVFNEYYRSPDLTAAAFVDGWYRTGDIGFLSKGDLYICGRSKELLIINGRNFYCHDIETIVSSMSGVIPGRVVAVGIEDDVGGGEQLLLIVEPTQNVIEKVSLARAIKDQVFGSLELMPYRVEFVPRGWLTKTTSGKLSRSENLHRLKSTLAEKDLHVSQA